MNQVRILAVLLLLLSGSNTGFAFTSGVAQFSLENDSPAQLSEDLHDLSCSFLLKALDLFNKKAPVTLLPFDRTENSRENSRSKGYLSISNLIEPGLSLAAIIFPFHSFL